MTRKPKPTNRFTWQPGELLEVNPKSVAVGIVGSRRRDTEEDFDQVLAAFVRVMAAYPIHAIVSGGCPQGGDRFAERIAREYSIEMVTHAPKWRRYGKAAGFVRNGLIARDADILIACVAADRKGGTEDTIKKYLKANKLRLMLVE